MKKIYPIAFFPFSIKKIKIKTFKSTAKFVKFKRGMRWQSSDGFRNSFYH
jgi:hypothetical protein